MNSHSKLILWRVIRINRATREQSHPWIGIDPANDKIPVDDLESILRIVKEKRSRGGITKYRRYFRDMEPDFSQLQWSNWPLTVLLPEYFEDDAGNRVGIAEFIDIKMGQTGTIVMGDPESLLRIGPTDMAHPERWTVEKANDIEHFLEVVDFLCKSEWISTPTGSGPKDPKGSDWGFHTTNIYVLNSVLVFIRQLYAEKDNLFGRTVQIYLEHCSDDGKKFWVTERQQRFVETLDTEPFLFGVGVNVTAKRMLKLFLYGFGLIHWGEKDRELANVFRKMVEEHGREKVLMGFQSTLQALVAYANHVFFPVAQDFSHWLNTQGHTRPNRITIHELLG
jgi:hypothetical protein